MARKKRKIKPLRLFLVAACLIASVVLVICLGIFGFGLLNRENRIGEVEAKIEETSLALAELQAAKAPSNLSADSYALLQESVRSQTSEYLSTLNGLLQDGLTDAEYEKFLELENPLDIYAPVISNITYYPQEVITYYNSEPGNLEFLLAYLDQEPYINQEVTISSQEKGSLYQSDLRWAFQGYDGSILALKGSLPTLLADIVNRIDDSTLSPAEIAEIPVSIEGIEDEVNYFWDPWLGYTFDFTPAHALVLINEVASRYGLNVEMVELNADALSGAISSGNPVLVQVVKNAKGDTSQFGEHFILLESVEDGNVHIFDPASRSNSEGTYSLSKLIESNIISARMFTKA